MTEMAAPVSNNHGDIWLPVLMMILGLPFTTQTFRSLTDGWGGTPVSLNDA